MAQDILRNIYLFNNMSADSLRRIDELIEQDSYQKTDEVFTQGDRATALYIIKFGSIQIHQKSTSGDKIEIAVLATGAHFGEMAFIDGEARSATAEAMEKCEILRIDYKKLEKTLKDLSRQRSSFIAHWLNFSAGA